MMPLLSLFAAPPANCAHSFFGLIPWFQYLPLNPSPDCSLKLDLTSSGNWNQLWLVGLAMADDLLRIAGLVAVILIIWGGVRLVTSAGVPQNVKTARETILNAIIGLVIAAVAVSAVNFVGNSLGGAGTDNGLPIIVAKASLVSEVVNIFLSIVGFIAVIMVVLGGIKYITSRGEPQQAASAKNTILYALIGLAVVVLAFSIVNFVIVKI